LRSIESLVSQSFVYKKLEKLRAPKKNMAIETIMTSPTKTNDSNKIEVSGIEAPNSEEATSQQAMEKGSSSGEDNVPLKFRTKYGYGIGHIIAEMCMALWYSYLVLYYQQVIRINPINVGYIFLVGQVFDAIGVVSVGVLSDRDIKSWLCVRYGKRKSWHLIGTIGTIICSLVLFTPPVWHIQDDCIKSGTCNDEVAMVAYYSVFAAVLNIAIAFVQIPHMAMIPEITPSKVVRASLSTIRPILGNIGYLVLYGITWALLGSGENTESHIGPTDSNTFLITVLISIVGLGGLTSGLFHWSVKQSDLSNTKVNEKSDSVDELTQDVESIANESNNAKTFLHWLLEPKFYLNAILYVSTRAFINIRNTYMPFYLQYSLSLPTTYVAIIPLVIQILGIVSLMLLKLFTKRFGQYKLAFVVSGIIGLAGCIWAAFGYTSFEDSKWQVIIVACLMGAGSTGMLGPCLTLIASMIGSNTESGAFVYGSMSFADKLTVGIGMMMIQRYVPSDLNTCTTNCNYDYFQHILVYGCGGAIVLGILATLILYLLAAKDKKNAESK